MYNADPSTLKYPNLRYCSIQIVNPAYARPRTKHGISSRSTQQRGLETLGVKQLYDFTLEKELVRVEEKRLPQKHNSSPTHVNNSTKRILSPLKDKLKQTTMGLLSEANNKVTMNASKFKIPKYSVSSNYNNNQSGTNTHILSSPSMKENPLELSASTEKKAITKKESCGKEQEKVDSNYIEKMQSSASNSNTKASLVTSNDDSSSRKGHGNFSKPSKKGSVKNSMGDIVQKYADVFSSVVACTGKS